MNIIKLLESEISDEAIREDVAFALQTPQALAIMQTHQCVDAGVANKAAGEFAIAEYIASLKPWHRCHGATLSRCCKKFYKQLLPESAQVVLA